ncbi:hypothetical protein CASFOL_026326 [Castilleja foliolosa]|uniref:C2 NT-type domain-containing protein n=1 Tax=Castilleja foliolosa TaxID=1961234 RepID=A0ABD3CIM7_9LAMI
MVLLGLKTNKPRNRNSPSASVQLNYIIHIQEINPWPPSQSLRTLGAVLIQWEHHDTFKRSCGSTNQVVPSLGTGSGVGTGRIEFNHSFRLPLKLVRDMSTGTFQKNCVEFSLYEPRLRDKASKGQLLGTAFLDLADYGVVKGNLSIRVPVNGKRTYRNSAQPHLRLEIQPVESVSALMSEEYTEEAEVASFATDDDNDDVLSLNVTSSSAAESNDSSSPLNKKDESISANGSAGEAKVNHVLDQFVAKPGTSSHFTSLDLSSDIAWISKGTKNQSLQSSAAAEVKQQKCSTKRYEYGEHEGQLQTKDGLLGDFDIHKEEFLVENRETNRSSISSNRKEAKVVHTKGTRGSLVLDSSSQILHLERRIKNLEGELMEVAAIEFSLYSVVAEHGCSMSKVHAPARRLSRLHFQNSNQHKRGTAAKSIASGLVLVAKACGNDVPRLTFWLSNSMVLRVIVNKNGKKKSSPALTKRITRGALTNTLSDWDNPLTFGAALERVEEWIFSRIIESLWWQVFTPHMQSRSGAAKALRKSSQSNQFSLQLWKKAFGDACERICPVRAEGHNCGCLSVLSKLIMDQLIARLDVSMFNAILRESDDEIPTNPIDDPISDAAVLPIQTGRASFGAGALLKNAVGNWSRWLTDRFGIDDDDFLANENNSNKSFSLLNALSDLMMLPKDMLLSPTTRKEVCPSFGPSLIRRILNNFVPDEFCPDPIPGAILESLDSELDSEEDSMMSFPCAATPFVYHAPSPALVAKIFGEIGSHSKLTRIGSSVLKKSQASDDELDELNSPLKAIILDNVLTLSPSSAKPLGISRENGRRDIVRYKLLQQVWTNSE